MTLEQQDMRLILASMTLLAGFWTGNANAISYSLNFSGPANGGSMGPSTSASYELLTGPNGPAEAFWGGCTAFYRCFSAPSYSGLNDLTLYGTWDNVGINLESNLNPHVTASTYVTPNPISPYLNSQISGTFNQSLLPTDLSLVTATKSLASRLSFSPSGTYINSYNPYIYSADWSMALNQADLPLSDLVSAQTIVTASFYAISNNGSPILSLSLPNLFSQTYQGTGVGHFSVDTSSLFALSSLPISGVINFTVEQRLLVTAVPEPETYALMLAGLGLLAFIARRRKHSLHWSIKK
jgi:hypothetical protein